MRPTARRCGESPLVQRRLTSSVLEVNDVLHSAMSAQHHFDHLDGTLGTRQVQRRRPVVLRAKQTRINLNHRM